VVRKHPDELGKRERQVVEAVYRLGEASVWEVLEAIPEAPGYSSLRATMNVLVRKGLLLTKKDGRKFVYFPAIPPEKARGTAIARLLCTYFDNSVSAAVSALLDLHGAEISDEEYRNLTGLIESRRRSGK